MSSESGELGREARAASFPIVDTGPEMPGGAYFGGRKSEIRDTAAGEASGGEGNDFVPGATHFGGWSEIGATVVKGASGGEMSDLRPGAA